MASFIESFLGFITEHALLTYFVIFLTCTLESLVLVGLVIPGSTLLVGLGAILATNVISWKLVVILAIGGAILGDFISFWIGQHYHLRIEQVWPFRKYPQMIGRGKVFFKKHGGKSVFLGRFFAPIRPMIPLIAGMMEMPAWNFFLFNALSAIAWVLIHLIPGFLLGGSLLVSGAVSARLSLLVIVGGLLLWVIFWYLWKAAIWVNEFRRNRDGAFLKLFAFALFIVWLFLAFTRSILPLPLLTRADESIYRFLASSRTAGGERIWITVSEFGDSSVNVLIIMVVLLILIFKAKYRSAAFWSVAVLGGAIFVRGFKGLFRYKRPTEIYEGISSFSFPSGHATMCAVIYGFLAIILWRSFKKQQRLLLLCVAVGFPVIMSFSRIYLGAHWLSDVLAGLSIGWAYVMFIGIFYEYKVHEHLPKNTLLVGVFGSLIVAGGCNVWVNYAEDVNRYRVHERVTYIDKRQWWDTEWQSMPSFRVDLLGFKEEPLTFQWAGSPIDLGEILKESGWHQALQFDLKKFLLVFLSDVDIKNFPVVSKLAGGRRETLSYVLILDEERIVLRLWPTEFQLEKSLKPLWVGSVESERLQHLLGLVYWPVESKNHVKGLEYLISATRNRPDIRVSKRFRPSGKDLRESSNEVVLMYGGSRSSF